MRVLFFLLSMLLLSPACSNGGAVKGGPSENEPIELQGNAFDSMPLPPPREPKSKEEDPNHDVDCDGIPDWEEAEWGTDPRNRDTDGDGVWDGIEVGRYASVDPLCENYFPPNLLPPTHRTDPLRKDTDCDGLADGEEDKNKNGRFEPELEETDPTQVDSDGDGIWDGIELGVTQATAAEPQHCPHARYADICLNGARRSLTLPFKADSDGDGLIDGLEDLNRNGCFESNLGETDPLFANPLGSIPQALAACMQEHLAPLYMRRHGAAQIALALPVGFENNTIEVERGGTHGLMGVDVERNVAFIAWRHAGSLSSLVALSQQHAARLSAQNLLVEPFTAWDGASAQAHALELSFHVSGSMSPAARANNIAETLLGAGEGSDSLPPEGTPGSTQHIRAQYILRDNGEVVVLMAVALENTPGNAAAFALAELAGSAALARYFDWTVVQCEQPQLPRRLVDFLFVVDDSASMTIWHAQLAEASAVMATTLSNSGLDWRAALVTSSYHLTADGGSNAGPNAGIIRGFTRDIQQLQAWLRPRSTCSEGRCSAGSGSAWVGEAPLCNGGGYNGGCWVGSTGSAFEGMLGAARLALMNMVGATEERIRFREEADMVVVILSDAEDQTAGWRASSSTPNNWEEILNFVEFFQGRSSTAPGYTGNVPPILEGKTVGVHAIYCPAGESCGDDRVPPVVPTRIQRIVETTGGVLTDIRSPGAVENTMADMVRQVIAPGAEESIQTQKPFIGASLRVAIPSPIGPCNGAHVPRSRVHGFDFGPSQTVSFFGDCRPVYATPINISYRSWEAWGK
ncbi:MAG: hypothetical protein FWG75_09440 [Cystobacterineae bacterium]|nr:hypothetical protein [Cystobacterineae bacterium]